MQHGATPGYGGSRPWTPLVLTLGLHLLLVLAWWTSARPAAPEPAPRASTLVLVQALPWPAPQPAAPAPPSRARARQPAVFVAPLPEPATPSSTPPPADPEPAGESQPDARGSPLPGDLLANSIAMAGQVDRDLRKGSSPITAEPERKWERFAEAFAAARASRPPGLTLESYTAPDGVTIYRKTVAGRPRCYRSGSVGGLVTGFGNADGHGAGRTTCPTNVSWTRR
ncbi:hypothetical protein ACHAC9_17675 [Massilia sp. CMS3.1]|uniref:hypothetical protein n=1 Tax=Massilia sp. CMS3.1 TaxID=3373083 RepID=UPI003EE4FB2B